MSTEDDRRKTGKKKPPPRGPRPEAAKVRGDEPPIRAKKPNGRGPERTAADLLELALPPSTKKFLVEIERRNLGPADVRREMPGIFAVGEIEDMRKGNRGKLGLKPQKILEITRTLNVSTNYLIDDRVPIAAGFAPMERPPARGELAARADLLRLAAHEALDGLLMARAALDRGLDVGRALDAIAAAGGPARKPGPGAGEGGD